MKFYPVFDYLTNSPIIDNGLEYFNKQKKAIAIAWLANKKKNINEAFGFLFNGVQSIEQKPKSSQTCVDYGIEDPGMFHFLYQKESKNQNNKVFALNTDYSIIFITASDVELIEGLKFM